MKADQSEYVDYLLDHAHDYDTVSTEDKPENAGEVVDATAWLLAVHANMAELESPVVLDVTHCFSKLMIFIFPAPEYVSGTFLTFYSSLPICNKLLASGGISFHHPLPNLRKHHHDFPSMSLGYSFF
jgi:hypothetical protein